MTFDLLASQQAKSKAEGHDEPTGQPGSGGWTRQVRRIGRGNTSATERVPSSACGGWSDFLKCLVTELHPFFCGGRGVGTTVGNTYSQFVVN